jgi:acetyl-CoA carboxylase biotin carboxyl carrier protein
VHNNVGNIADDISDKEDFNDVIEVKSPFVGVFYSTASPDNLPFVSIGSEVKEGDVMCIVESMKIMNEIVAPKDGKVIDICVKNKDIVEFGQVLYKLI